MNPEKFPKHSVLQERQHYLVLKSESKKPSITLNLARETAIFSAEEWIRTKFPKTLNLAREAAKVNEKFPKTYLAMKSELLHPVDSNFILIVRAQQRLSLFSIQSFTFWLTKEHNHTPYCIHTCQKTSSSCRDPSVQLYPFRVFLKIQILD